MSQQRETGRDPAGNRPASEKCAEAPVPRHSCSRNQQEDIPIKQGAQGGTQRASLNQIVCALRFFHGITLGEAEVPDRIAFAREPRKLPVVPSADEVVLFLKSVSTLKSRAALTTAYAAG